MKRPSSEEIFNRLWEDNYVWMDFVDDFIARNQDSVHELVSDWLSNELGEPGSYVNDEYAEFVNKAVESEISEYEDRKYHEWKDDR